MNTPGLRVRLLPLALAILALTLGVVTQRVGAVAPAVAPAAADDAYTAASDAPIVPLTVPAPGLLANDYGETLTAIKVSDPTHGSVTVSANGSFTYTPSGPYAGPDTFTYKVNDGRTDSAPATVTITVTHASQAPAITSANSATFTVGTPGSFTVTTTGFPLPTLSETGTLPTGVMFMDNMNGTATLSGTPMAGTGGSYPITITANNGVMPNATQMFTLIVNQAPAITSANSATFTVGTPGTFSVTTTGVPAVTTIMEMGALPTGVMFMDNGNGTATLSGTPMAGTGGSYPITIMASNGVTPKAVQMFTLTVNEAPAITSMNNTTFTLNMMGSFTVTTTGFPKPTLSEMGALPTGVTFMDNMNGTATLGGTPTNGGVFPLTITASNGVGTPATQMFTLSVTQAPTITSANSTTFTVGTAGNFTVMTTGVPTPTVSETGALPTGVTFTDNGNGTAALNGVPTPGTGGSYPITITASNGVMPNATQMFTLAVNEAPAITSANSATFTVGTPGSFTVTTTGFPKPTLSEMGALPTGVMFMDNMNGTATLSGTPMAGTGGSYPITITASNGVMPNAIQMFTLAVNEAPAITSANSATFTVGTPGSFTVTTTGFPKPTLSETGALPTGVMFADNGNGTATLSGTPAMNTGGSYPITITANNGVGTAATQMFTLTVNQAPAITSVNSTTFTEAMLGSFTVTTTGFPRPMLSETGALPSGVTFTDNGNGIATLGGTPAAGTSTSSPYTFTITASNGVGTAATQMFTLTVKPPPPVANNDTYPQTVIGNVGINSAAIPYSVTTNDTSTVPFTITMYDATSANGGTVSMTTSGMGIGQFTYNPPAGFTGTDTFTYTITNAGGSATATVSIPVSGMIWFINNAGTPGDGRLSSPFNSLAAFQAVNDGVGRHPKANDNIFLYDSATHYTGPVTLLNGQKLIGQDATSSLSTITGLTPGTGSAALPATGGGSPNKVTITATGNTVTLGSGNTVWGLTLGNATGTALTGASVGALKLRELPINTTGAAINLSNGALDAILPSVSAGGGTNGIALSTTTGSFAITGDGASDPLNTTRGRTTAKSGGGTITLGSGGTIQNTTGAGIALNNATNVSLTSMVIQNTTGNGITAATVSGGLTLDNTLVSETTANNALNGTSVANLQLQHTELAGTTANVPIVASLTSLGGTSAIANSTIHDGKNFVVQLVQQNMDTATLTVTNGAFTNSTNEVFNVTGNGNANTTFSLTGSTVSGAQTTGFQYAGNGDSYGSVTVDTNTFDQNGVDIDIDHQGAMPTGASNGRTLTFEVSGNTTRQTFKSGSSNSINIFLAGNSQSGAKMVGTVKGNTIGKASVANSGSDLGSAIGLDATGNGTMTIAVKTNTINQVRGTGNSAVFIQNGTGSTTSSTSTLNLYLHDNSVTTNPMQTGQLAGYEIVNGANTGDSGTMFIDLGTPTNHGNNSAVLPADAFASVYLYTVAGTPTTNVYQYTGAANDTTALQNYITSVNGTLTPAPNVFVGAGTIQGTTTSPTFPT